MSEFSVTWIPGNGRPSVTFSTNGAPYFLKSLEGLLTGTSSPIMNQSPGQHGTSLLDSAVDTRVVTIPGAILASSVEQTMELRADLVRSLVTLPVRPGGTAERGVLRVDVPGQPTREIVAVPDESPQDEWRGPTWVDVDLEFHCPYPFWRDLSDSNIQLMPGETGMTFPMTFPFSMAAGQAEADIVNAGDVPAPVLIRVWGEITTPRIINSTTGESIEVSGSIAAGEFLEIETAFGEKRVELVKADGTRENWMSNLNLDDSDFWHLATGLNTVRLQADANVSGVARVFWRNRYAGI